MPIEIQQASIGSVTYWYLGTDKAPHYHDDPVTKIVVSGPELAYIHKRFGVSIPTMLDTQEGASIVYRQPWINFILENLV